jgi:hypothetical protein
MRWSVLPPDELGLDRLEERLDRGIVVTVSPFGEAQDRLAAHRGGKLILLQPLLVIVSAVLAAAITVENAARWRIAQTHSHVERLHRQVLLHPVADRPPERVEGQQRGVNADRG